jgi:hypothetical protein
MWTACEALPLDGDERWEPLRPTRAKRAYILRARLWVGGCVIVAGGISGSTTVVEVYEEALRRWRRLPYNVPRAGVVRSRGALLYMRDKCLMGCTLLFLSVYEHLVRVWVISLCRFGLTV